MYLRQVLSFKNVPLFLVVLLPVFLFLSACGDRKGSPDAASIRPESGFSASIPTSIQKHGSGLSLRADLSIDSGPALALVVDIENDVVRGPKIEGLSPGTHTLTINYYLNDILVATATTEAEVIAGQTTSTAPAAFQLNSDLDGDGISGIDEVISGSDPNDASSGPQAPNGVIDPSVSDQTIIAGGSVNFTGTATDFGNDTPFSYLWDFDGGAPNNSTDEDPGPVRFDNAGVYTVTFTVTDSLGFPDPTPDSRTITVTNVFAYATNFGSDNVTAYRVEGADGTLIKIGTTEVITGSRPLSVVVDPSGKFVYAANRGTDSVTAYTIDAASGALTKIGTTDVSTGSSPGSVTVDPGGKFAYVANRGSGSVTAYAIDAASGALTKIGTTDVATGSGPSSVAVDPSGKFAYVANGVSDSVTAYTIDTASGALTKISDTDVATGDNPTSVTVSPSGFAYVTNWGSDNITAYKIDAESGFLRPIGTVLSGTSPRSATVDPSGKFAYVANVSSDSVTVYTIAAASGALTKIGATDVGTGSNPYSVAADPSGKFVYVVNGNADSVTAYRIDATSGALAKIGTIDATTGSGPRSIALSSGGVMAASGP